MKISLLPLLEIQKEIYTMPPDINRFKKYLYLMLNDNKTDLKLPLTSINPMEKKYVLNSVERLINIKVEYIISNVIKKITFQNNYEIEVGIVIVDDLMGGWTNKYLLR